MSQDPHSDRGLREGGGEAPDNGVPPANRRLQVLGGVLLAIPLLGLLPVGWYSRKDPQLAGFPFFIWYQMMWVFLCAGFTYSAYVVIKRARPHRPMNSEANESSPTGAQQ